MKIILDTACCNYQRGQEGGIRIYDTISFLWINISVMPSAMSNGQQNSEIFLIDKIDYLLVFIFTYTLAWAEEGCLGLQKAKSQDIIYLL